MTEPLYTLEILRLAAKSASIGRLAGPTVSASKRAPLCGSDVTIDLLIDGDRIAAIGGEVRACAFGQASASVFAKAALGKSAHEISDARDGLALWLRQDTATLPDLPGIEALAPARRKPTRHAAILLPFDAALAALAPMNTSA